MQSTAPRYDGPRVRRLALLLLASALGSGVAIACDEEESASAPESSSSAEERERERLERERREREARIAREYPKHVLVHAKQLRVRREPSRRGEVIGWVRRGHRLRARAEPVGNERCRGGWYALYPEGFACATHEIVVGDEPPEPDFRQTTLERVEEPLPYDYFFVNRQNAPQFFREPTREEHRQTLAYMRRLQHYQEDEPRRLEAFLEGRIRGEPTRPEVIYDVLDRGNFVASPHEEDRDGEEFVWTVLGRVMLAAQLDRRRASDFSGVPVTPERPLPIAWANRPAHPLEARPRADGNYRWVEDETLPLIERYQILEDWRGRKRMGRYYVDQIGEDRYLKEWFVSVAEVVDPTFDVDPEELWIHVDRSEGTLVVYRWRQPIFATLVSVGLKAHETPTGLFRIQRKFVGRTMDNIGPDTGDDDYRIEDVPWTQYFYRSIALHGAFWHDRFGVPRSHGCVNLSPRDARRIFQWTEPEVPETWFGIHTRRNGEDDGTRVWVTH